ncbi:O-antigen ligase family protein, partial [Alphaproteobacteria bacterium]|nr:O-antigen ligase family protein [Alphaproteobacteria bacterium]
MSHLDQYINQHAYGMKIIPSFKAIIQDAKDALAALPRWERGFHIFWLLGPFILLIERSPADFWVSLLALTFVIRSVFKGDREWLKPFWVRAGFAFWIWCIIAGAVSDFPAYSVGEAIVWFRFPLFAMATAFWLARDKRLLYAMLISAALGLVVICGILTAEIMIVGQQGGRLSWPYGDLVPGNYVAKVGLPAFTIMVALAVSINGRVAALSGVIALFTLAISVMTGERINFLIRACGGMLAGLVWKPKWGRYLGLVAIEVLAVVVIFSALPGTASRYTDEFIAGATNPQESAWLKTINGGWQVAQDNLMFGIGTGNYRLVSYEGILDNYENVRPDVHPHNYYVQMLLETGVIGFILGVVFLWSIIWACFRASFKNRENVFVATAWVIPFGLFWPISTTA